TGQDNNGFISQVNTDGSIRQLLFIAGGKDGVTLNAPKGMAIHNGVLYVADINAVRRFDVQSGKPQGAVSLPKATFLNDIAVGADGALFVSDSGLKLEQGQLTSSGTDAIYRIEGTRVSVLARGPQLKQPNGLLYLDGGLLSVSFASNELMQL